jgi:phosphodiesterase/alkaline phosphatase D-like protein
VQKQLFKDALLRSTAKFKFVINGEPIQQLFVLPYDRWEGYAAERTEILNFIRTNDLTNVIFLTTDLHANLMNEVFVDRFSDATPIADEFVTGPIATQTLQEAILARGGAQLLDALHALLDLVGIDCRHLDVYSYGTVEVNANAGTATVTLKDDTGAVITDTLNANVRCVKTVGQ